MTLCKPWRHLLQQIDEGSDVEDVRAEARRLFDEFGTESCQELEVELAARGASLEMLREVCDSPQSCHAGGSVDAFRSSLPDGHVLATFIDEHAHILRELEELAEALAKDDPSWLDVLRVSVFLIGVEPHHAREEQVLFPLLRDRGLEGPPAVMEKEHEGLRALKHRLHDHAQDALNAADPSENSSRWRTVQRDGAQLVDLLRQHIDKENNILYPMALQAIPERRVWQDARRRCDEIGYCCEKPAT